jgi:hypothetical protein
MAENNISSAFLYFNFYDQSQRKYFLENPVNLDIFKSSSVSRCSIFFPLSLGENRIFSQEREYRLLTSLAPSYMVMGRWLC